MGYFGELYYPETKRIFVGEPIEDMKTVAKALETTYNTAKEGADALDIMAKNLNVLDEDYAIKKASIEKIRKSFKTVGEQGNWEDAGNTLSSEYKDFATNEGITLAKSKYDVRNAYIKDLKSKQSELGWSDEKLNEFIAASDKLGSTPVTFYDPLTKEPLEYNEENRSKGMWKGSYTGYVPGKNIDITDKLNEITTGFMADTYGTGKYYKDSSGDYYITDNGVTKKVADADILSFSKQYIANDPEIQRYFKDLDYIRNANYKITGNTNYTLSEITDYLQSYIGTTYYDATKGWQTYTENDALTELTKAKDLSQSQLNDVANKLKAELSINANVNKHGYIEEKPDIDLTANWKAEADYKRKLEKQVVEIKKKRQAIVIPALQSTDTETLNTAITNSKEAIATEVKKIIDSYNELGGKQLNYSDLVQLAKNNNTSVAEQVMAMDKAGKFNDIRDKLNISDYKTFNELVDNYEILQIRDKEADKEAAKALGYTEDGLSEKLNDLKNSIKVIGTTYKSDRYGEMTEKTKYNDSYYAYHKLLKDVANAKDKYLESSSKGATQTVEINSKMPGETDEQRTDRTNAIIEYFKNPLEFIKLQAYNSKGKLVNITDIIEPKGDNGEAGYTVSTPSISMTPEGENMETTLTITVSGKGGKEKDIIIPASEIPTIDEWVNSPENSLNTKLLKWSSNGITKRTIPMKSGGELIVNLPKGSGETYYDNSAFTVIYPDSIDEDGKVVSKLAYGEGAWEVLKKYTKAGELPSIYNTKADELPSIYK